MCTYIRMYMYTRYIMFNFCYSGVPLVHIVRNTLVLESPSEMSHSEADKVNIRMYVCNIYSITSCMFHRVMLWLLSLCAFNDLTFVA